MLVSYISCITGTLHIQYLTYTVPPESIYPLTEVYLWPICRLTVHFHLGKDAVSQNFTEVLPRFAVAYNTAINSKM